jgi:hypothetical protein
MSIRLRGYLLQLVAVAALAGFVAPSRQLAAQPAGKDSTAAEYVTARLAKSSVLLLGEAHWIRQDVQLLAEVIRGMPAANLNAVAVEWIPASEQPSLDTLLADARWNRARAIRSLRSAAWPYEEYLEVLHAAWIANHEGGGMRLFALGPGEDWRARLLPLGKNYESYMADSIMSLLKAGQKPLLVSLGMHHSFTRHYLPDLPEKSGQRVGSFSDRTGNLLRRALGERVFQVALAYPWTCWDGSAWGKCLPLDGAIDCAMRSAQRPSGFDIEKSPWRDALIRKEFWFSIGYPAVRFIDLADGYVWQGPVETLENVRLIPLDQYAPDSAALAAVIANVPFGELAQPTRAGLQKVWDAERVRLSDVMTARGWNSLRDWKSRCSRNPGK